MLLSRNSRPSLLAPAQFRSPGSSPLLSPLPSANTTDACLCLRGRPTSLFLSRVGHVLHFYWPPGLKKIWIWRSLSLFHWVNIKRKAESTHDQEEKQQALTPAPSDRAVGLHRHTSVTQPSRAFRHGYLLGHVTTCTGKALPMQPRAVNMPV